MFPEQQTLNLSGFQDKGSAIDQLPESTDILFAQRDLAWLAAIDPWGMRRARWWTQNRRVRFLIIRRVEVPGDALDRVIFFGGIKAGQFVQGYKPLGLEVSLSLVGLYSVRHSCVEWRQMQGTRGEKPALCCREGINGNPGVPAFRNPAQQRCGIGPFMGFGCSGWF